MSDEVAKQFEKETTPETPQGRSMTFSITLHPNGELELSGPIGNKVLSYGLLGAAASKLDEIYTIQALEAKVAKASASRGGMAGLLKRMNGG